MLKPGWTLQPAYPPSPALLTFPTVPSISRPTSPSVHAAMGLSFRLHPNRDFSPQNQSFKPNSMPIPAPPPTLRLPEVGSPAQPLSPSPEVRLPPPHTQCSPKSSTPLLHWSLPFLERKQCALWRKQWWPSGGHFEQGSKGP